MDMPAHGVVSNPHRYGQRQMEGRLQTETYEAFQTLIGTVKGYDGSTLRVMFYEFQTLIGTVKGRYTGSVLEEFQFQTLIGTVKGGREAPLPQAPPLVSNPHRYGQRPSPMR